MRLVLIGLCFMLMTGCTGYGVVSATSWGTTGKGLTDHVVSGATGADCNATHVIRADYYCEERREPGTTFNRSAF